ncbi:MAG: polyphenol oxidase family protein [Deltaproteobacteria bacterium]|nr:polyphenol oxidase family protein [Deltaproteobacteria bacterium]
MSFVEVERGPFQILAHGAWLENGLMHGFCNGSVNFKGDCRGAAREAFERAFGLKQLLLMTQAHTDRVCVVDLGQIGSMADAEVLVNLEAYDAAVICGVSPQTEPTAAIGILTADCLPMILRCGRLQTLAVIHAGWRGLASGIIANTVDRFGSSHGELLEVLLGPCAGNDQYQVGREVIDRIGESAVSKVMDDRLILDLQATAFNQLRCCWRGELEVISAPVCTILNFNFHSYRREGDSAGRNLSFVSF